MSKAQSNLKTLTANRLHDGLVVFLSSDGSWSERVDNADVAKTDDAVSGLERIGVQAVKANIVVDPYLVDVAIEGARITPLANRERFRTRGPSVRKDLGHQAIHPIEQPAQVLLAAE